MTNILLNPYPANIAKNIVYNAFLLYLLFILIDRKFFKDKNRMMIYDHKHIKDKQNILKQSTYREKSR